MWKQCRNSTYKCLSVCVCVCARAHECLRCLGDLETLVTDLEYANEMALLADNLPDLTSRLEALSTCFKKLGLSISCKKTKSLAVLPFQRPDALSPAPIHLVPGEEPIEVVLHFQYLGSIVQDDCGVDTERLALGSAKSHQHFSPCLPSCGISARSRPPPRILFSSVIILILLYGLESSVLLKSHIRRLQSFVIHCLRIIVGISIRQKKCHTTTRKMAKQQRISSILAQCCLRFLGHLSQMPDSCLPKQLFVSVCWWQAFCWRTEASME